MVFLNPCLYFSRRLKKPGLLFLDEHAKSWVDAHTALDSPGKKKRALKTSKCLKNAMKNALPSLERIGIKVIIGKKACPTLAEWTAGVSGAGQQHGDGGQRPEQQADAVPLPQPPATDHVPHQKEEWVEGGDGGGPRCWATQTAVRYSCPSFHYLPVFVGISISIRY